MSAGEGPTFAEVFSAAVRDRGLPLERIKRRLDAAGVGVSVATLSYWQSGRSRPTRVRSLSTLQVLENILELPPGTLTSLANNHLTDYPHALDAFIPASELVPQLVRDLQIGPRELTPIWFHDTLFVSAEGHEIQQRSRAVMRAEVEQAQRCTVVLQQDTTDHVAPKLTDLHNCEIVKAAEVPESQLIVAQLMLHSPLQRGDSALVEYTWELAPTGSIAHRVSRLQDTRSSVLGMVLEVQFDASHPPRKAWAFAENRDEPGETTPLAVVNGLAQRVFMTKSAGVVGIAWDWS